VEVILRRTVSRPGDLGVRHPSRAHHQILITIRPRPPSLTRGRACHLPVQSLPGLAITATLRFKSRSTRDHILQSHLRLGSFFVASYDSQGYDEGILFRLCGGGQQNGDPVPGSITGSVSNKTAKNSIESCAAWTKDGPQCKLQARPLVRERPTLETRNFQSKKRKVKSDHGLQSRAQHHDRLADSAVV
jgi:hypothetical protein